MTELNKRLLSACTSEFNGYSQIEQLLLEGAEPLGIVINDYGEEDNLFGAVVDEYSTSEDYSRLHEITKLFCQHGMDLSKPSIPYDDCKIINPVWYFTILMNDGVLPILEYLLDRGLDYESAHSCWYHAIEYWFFADGSMRDERSRKQVVSDLRKILLIASYPSILENDVYLQEIVWLNRNDYDITKLRNWDKYSVAIDDSRCAGYPHVIEALFTFTDKDSGKEVWKIGFGLDKQE